MRDPLTADLCVWASLAAVRALPDVRNRRRELSYQIVKTMHEAARDCALRAAGSRRVEMGPPEVVNDVCRLHVWFSPRLMAAEDWP